MALGSFSGMTPHGTEGLLSNRQSPADLEPACALCTTLATSVTQAYMWEGVSEEVMETCAPHYILVVTVFPRHSHLLHTHFLSGLSLPILCLLMAHTVSHPDTITK